jgi:hypothetical protein
VIRWQGHWRGLLPADLTTWCGPKCERDVLIVKADRQEPLVVVRLSLAAEIAAPRHIGRDTR